MDALLEEAPCGFLVFDNQGVVTLINRTLARWLGYTVAELQGRKFESLMGIAGRIFYHTHFFPLLSIQGQAQEIFMVLHTKDKAELPVLINARREELNGLAENHCVMMPVHQRKKYEAELLQAKRALEETMAQNEQLQQATSELERSKMALDQQVTRLSQMNNDLTNFSKVISHDMQEPVRKIAMFADMLIREKDHASNPKIRYATERITSASRRMRRLTACLEEYVGIDISNDASDSCNLNTLVEAARVRAENTFAGAPIHLRLENTLPVITGRCTQIEELLFQLIANAVQFRKAGADSTEIRITTDIIQQNLYRNLQYKYRYADFVRIVFSDDGEGFPPEYSEYIFGLFKKVHEDKGGMGFGLALCRKIVSNHLGFISAKSNVGQGATFTVLLPVGPAETEQ